jgi:hypothetical protein
MLRILTNLNLLNRQDFEATAGLLASGYTGTWVAKIAGDKVDLPASAGDTCIGAVWTESNRDGSVGWTPDVDATGKLTVLFGKFRALTDQFTSTPSIGDALKVGTNGKLASATLGGTDRVVAYCTKASHTVEHLGKTHTVIEYVTA